MSLFNKKIKGKKEESAPQATLQDLQGQFNQLIFQLGDLYYRKHMIDANVTAINSDINTLKQKADNIGKEAQLVRSKMDAEVAAKIKEGAGNEESDNQAG